MAAFRLPKLRQHKATGRAYVELTDAETGERWPVYCGDWPRESGQSSGQAQAEYERVIAEWLSNGRRKAIQAGPDMTMVEMIAAYLRHARGYYRRPDGTPTDRLHVIETAVAPLRRMYGRSLAAEFGPLAFRAVRQHFVEKGLARSTVNDYMKAIRMMFSWAVSEELLPPAVLQAMKTVPGLRRGRTDAREPEAKKPIPQAHIDAVVAVLPSPLAALVRLQRLTAARPGELVGICPRDIDTTGRVWVVEVREHKTAYTGAQRHLYIGPRGQEVVKPFLNRPLDKPMFSPREAQAEAKAKGATKGKPRRKNQKPNAPQTARKVGEQYTPDSYRRAIERACEVADVPRWTPHRLRHTAAHQLRKRHGLEVAQAILGHADAETTETYAEPDVSRAKAVIAKVG